MAETNAFLELMERVRAGDQQAAADLVRRYEGTVRRAIRIWLIDARLRRLFDSMDICQSVLGSFFVRVALGQYHLQQPEQLVRLLLSMARHKLADQVRRERADCRDNRRLEAGDIHGREVIATEAGPSRRALGRDLLCEVRKRLSPEERRLADHRALGREWPEIAAELGGEPSALRKKFTRALDRVARELELDDE